MLRVLSLQCVALALIALAGCAHGNGAQAEAAARQACEGQNTPASEMNACIEQMLNALEHTRMPPPPPPAPVHPSN
jgi:hypothetical protein